MALTDSDKLRSSNDKKFKGHTEDKTIKVASGKKFINAGIQGVAKTFTKLNPSFYITNVLRDIKANKYKNKK